MRIGTNVGSNPASAYYSQETPFINLIKQFGLFAGVIGVTRYDGNSTPTFASIVQADADGYPTSMVATGGYGTFAEIDFGVFINTSSTNPYRYQTGQYVLLYSGGDGTETFAPHSPSDATITAGTWGSGRIGFTVSSATGNGIRINLTGLPASGYLRNFHLLYSPASTAATPAAAEHQSIASSTTITGAASNGSGLIRLTLSSPISASPTNYWSSSTLLTVSGVTGTTEANGTWPITIIDGTHVDLVGSAFANAYTGLGVACDLSQCFDPVFISKTSFFRFYRFMGWLSTIDAAPYQQTWSDRPTVSGASWNGKPGSPLPIETAVALCNKIGVDAWFNIPAIADDTYVRNFAKLVHRCSDNSTPFLNANLKVALEYYNEIWNYGGGNSTFQTRAQGFFPTVNPSSTGTLNNYMAALMPVRCWSIWYDEWGAESARIIRVLAWQNGTGSNTSSTIYHIMHDFTADYMAANAGLVGGYAAGASGSFWPASSTMPGMLADVYSTACYVPNGQYQTFPAAWGNDATGLDLAFQEIMSGGVYPTTSMATTGPDATVASAAVNNGGTAGTYAVNDILTVVGGTGTPATVTVATVNAGKVATITLTSAGSYSVNPTLTGVATTNGGQGGGTGTGATLNLTIANQSAYTLASGLSPSLPATPLDKQMVSATFNAPSSSGATLAVDGGTAYPIVTNYNTAIGTNGAPINTQRALCFNSAINSWQLLDGLGYTDVTYGNGVIAQEMSAMGVDITTVTLFKNATGRQLTSTIYEAGQNFNGKSISQLYNLYKSINNDQRMYDFYMTMMKKLNALGFTDFAHFTTVYSDGSSKFFWGALETIWQSSSTPKYAALYNYANPKILSSLAYRLRIHA